MRLTARLSVFFVSLSLIPVAIVGYISYKYGRAAIEKEVKNHLLSTNLQKEAEINRWLTGQEQRMRDMARRPLIVRFSGLLADTQPESAEFQRLRDLVVRDHFTGAVSEINGITEFFLLHPETGQVMASTNPGQERKFRENRPYFIEGRKRTYIQNVYYSLSLQQSAMTIGTPVTDKEGRLAAVLAGRIDFSVLSGIMSHRSGLIATEDTYLVNAFAFFVTEPRFGANFALKKSLNTRGVQEALAGRSGVDFYTDYRGTPVIGAFRWVSDREMCLITEMDQAEAFAPVHTLRNVVSRVGICAALAAVFAGWLCASAIVRPLQRLRDATAAIGRGELDHPVEISDTNEIGELALAFTRMAKTLKETTVSRDVLMTEIEFRKQAESALRESEERHRDFLNAATDMAFVKDDRFRYLLVNKANQNFFGKTESEILGKTDFDLMPHDMAEACRRSDREALEKMTVIVTDESVDSRVYETRKFPVRIGEESVGVGAFIRDVTEIRWAEEARLELERRIQHSRRLESLGTMAGGIAHDFNNLLMSILGNLELAMMDLPSASSIHATLNDAVAAAHRAADLTRQILAFSGKSWKTMKSVNLTDLVKESAHLLKSAISPCVTLKLDLAESLPPVSADPDQILQVITNVVSNASEAIEGREGFVTIRTDTVICSAGDLAESRLEERPPPGRFVCVQVCDTGCGMDEATLDRLFDPFFSTKFTGRGLGMPAVMGIVRGHQGAILVESRVGKGTSVRILLPVAADEGLPD